MTTKAGDLIAGWYAFAPAEQEEFLRGIGVIRDGDEEGYALGVDCDDQDPQLKHICFRYPGPALCHTKELWFIVDRAHLDEADCPACLARYGRRKEEAAEREAGE